PGELAILIDRSGQDPDRRQAHEQEAVALHDLGVFDDLSAQREERRARRRPRQRRRLVDRTLAGLRPYAHQIPAGAGRSRGISSRARQIVDHVAVELSGRVLTGGDQQQTPGETRRRHGYDPCSVPPCSARWLSIAARRTSSTRTTSPT